MKLNYKRLNTLLNIQIDIKYKEIIIKNNKTWETGKNLSIFEILCRKIRSDLKKLLSKLGYYKIEEKQVMKHVARIESTKFRVLQSAL